MFGFLKDKLKKAVGIFSKKVEEEAKEEPPAEPVVEKKEQKELPKEKKPEIKEAPARDEKKPAPISQKKEEKHISKEVHAAKHEAEKEAVHKAEHRKAAPEITKKHEEHKAAKPATEALVSEVRKEEAVEKPKEEKPVEKKPVVQDEPHKPEIKEAKQEKKGLFSGLFGKKDQHKETPKAEMPVQKEEQIEEQADRSFIGKISDTFTKVTLSDDKFEELFWDLELAMLENNVAVEVIDKIKKDLKESLVEKKLPKKNLDELIAATLRDSIEGLFEENNINLVERIREKKPYIIAFIGINGSGKTTSLAKLIYMLKKSNLSVAVGACDTFRAAAIQQIEVHTNKLGVKLIKHDYGADPAAVAFDTIEHAKAKGIDVVLLDTGGRQHSNKNLMDELKKLIRVAKPDLKIFVGESITGNDCVEQVKMFNQEVGIDGIILSKADIDEKGGAAVSVSYVTKKPILYLGTGQEYDDLVPFNREEIIEKIGLA